MSKIISTLDNTGSIYDLDFFPILDHFGTSSRSSIQSLGDWVEISGSASFSSVVNNSALSDTSSYSFTSLYTRYAQTSSLVDTASYVDVSAINFIDFSLSSSWTSQSLSASYAKTASNAPYSIQTFVSYSLSSSWASQSLSSSNATQADYVVSASLSTFAANVTITNHPGLIKCSAMVSSSIAQGGGDFGAIIITQSQYNVASIVYIDSDNRPTSNVPRYNYGLTFTNALPTNNYILMGSGTNTAYDNTSLAFAPCPVVVLLKNSSSADNTTTYCTYSIYRQVGSAGNGDGYADLGNQPSVNSPYNPLYAVDRNSYSSSVEIDFVVYGL